tara:strand:+ start:453 stop:773 length:321 start_codon:yes stop_codon:yes gene_type:complete
MVNDIKKNLTNIVIILGLVSSIGVGFTQFAKMQEQVSALREASKSVDLSVMAVLEEKIAVLESKKINTSGIGKNKTEIAILKKEIQLLILQFNELKLKNSNPLGNG